MAKRITDPMPAPIAARFAEAGTTFDVRPDGRVAVGNWPTLRVSNPNFLSEEFARFEADRANEPEE